MFVSDLLILKFLKKNKEKKNNNYLTLSILYVNKFLIFMALLVFAGMVLNLILTPNGVDAALHKAKL